MRISELYSHISKKGAIAVEMADLRAKLTRVAVGGYGAYSVPSGDSIHTPAHVLPEVLGELSLSPS